MDFRLHPKLKVFLVVSFKNGLNAILINGGLMLKWHFIFNFDNWAGFFAVVQATGLVVASREVAVWGPLLLKWTQTNADPDAAAKALADAAAANKQVAKDIAVVKENLPAKPPEVGH